MTTLHMHIELKLDGQWFHYAAPSILKNGRVHGLLAGIGSQETPVAPLKGLPPHLSFVTNACYKQDKRQNGIHHEGWLSADELRVLQERLNEPSPFSYGIKDLEEDLFHCYVNGNAVASHQGWDDVRLVFWFDN